MRTEPIPNSVCKYVNARLVSIDAPVLDSAPNNQGGVDFSVANGNFNGGHPADRFCAPGAGANGNGIFLLGLPD